VAGAAAAGGGNGNGNGNEVGYYIRNETALSAHSSRLSFKVV
jgi:hypothetical protein